MNRMRTVWLLLGNFVTYFCVAIFAMAIAAIVTGEDVSLIVFLAGYFGLSAASWASDKLFYPWGDKS